MTALDITVRPTGDPAPSLVRWLALSGVAFALLTAAGDLVIGDFPGGGTAPSALTDYYARHHDQVGVGGHLLGFGVIFLGLFVSALVVRARPVPAAAAVIGVGGAAYVAAQAWSATVYAQLGSIGHEAGVSPEALQAWHVAGAEWEGVGSGYLLLVIGVGLAALVAGSLPGWVAVSGLVVGAATLAPQPFGFFAGLLLVVWVALTGVVLAVRPEVTGGPQSAAESEDAARRMAL